ncbi:MAG TPA: hypothetical protein VI583_08220 [Cyclobacteriaceae bacterium]|nr:hypothetical protein [Cyclobacteriaceae bacterium]
MNYRLFLYFTIFIYSNLVSTAQELCLRLDRPGFRRDITYFKGDEIVFRMKWESFNRHDKIIGFSDSSILFYSYDVPVKDIAFVRTEHNNGLLSPSNGPKLILAGFALPVIDILNYSALQGNNFQADEGLLIVSGSLIAAGLFWTSLRYHQFRPGNTRKIRIASY